MLRNKREINERSCKPAEQEMEKQRNQQPIDTFYNFTVTVALHFLLFKTLKKKKKMTSMRNGQC